MTENRKVVYRYGDLYRKGKGFLQGMQDAELDARFLLEAVCGTDLQTLLVHPEKEVSEEEKKIYENYLNRRKNREPLAYILGEQEFMGISFLVSDSVLIPNQDTECLVEKALSLLHDNERILDLCTGSGCILLSLLFFCGECTGKGTDLSGEALKVAESNAERLKLAQRASFEQGDLFEAVPEGETFDMIVSNPPYIATAVIEKLEPEVRSAEPVMALDGGEDGLVFYRKIIRKAPDHLNRGGRFLTEIGYDQGEAVRQLFAETGFRNIEVIRDYSGNDRVVSGII